MRWRWSRTMCPQLSTKSKNASARPVRRFIPHFDVLEDRVVPALFLQGQVINDVTLTPLPGATITLENSAGNPILNNGTPITTTTDANGNYLFNDTNTFG